MAVRLLVKLARSEDEARVVKNYLPADLKSEVVIMEKNCSSKQSRVPDGHASRGCVDAKELAISPSSGTVLGANRDILIS